MTEVHCIHKADAKLGECPRWHPVERKLYWTDIDACKIWRIALDGSAAECVTLTQKVGCFAFRANGEMVLAMERGVYAAEPFADPRDLQVLCAHPEPEQAAAGCRFNDGRCDAQGRLVVGTVDPSRSGQAKLYSLEPDARQMQLIESGFTTCNGLAFHPHMAEVWYTDTPKRQIFRSAYDLATGRFAGREVVYAFAQNAQARPDGACFDSSGNYWCAMYAGGCVCKISRNGRLLAEVNIPACYTTMPAFAGAQLDALAVTSAQREDDAQEKQRHPDAGGVFLVSDLDSRGCEEHFFGG